VVDEEEDALHLMQLRGNSIRPDSIVEKPLASPTSTKSSPAWMRQRTALLTGQYSFIQDLLKQHAAGKLEKLPPDLQADLDKMMQNAKDVQTKVEAESKTQETAIKDHQTAFDTCQNTAEAGRKKANQVEGTEAESAAKQHCECRVREATQEVNLTGCNAKLSCLKDDMDAKKKNLDDWMKNGTHCENCTRPGGGATPEQFRSWVKERKGDCETHWGTKRSEFRAKKGVYGAAQRSSRTSPRPAGTSRTRRRKSKGPVTTTRVSPHCASVNGARQSRRSLTSMTRATTNPRRIGTR
jgi:hypothetical protein